MFVVQALAAESIYMKLVKDIGTQFVTWNSIYDTYYPDITRAKQQVVIIMVNAIVFHIYILSIVRYVQTNLIHLAYSRINKVTTYSCSQEYSRHDLK